MHTYIHHTKCIISQIHIYYYRCNVYMHYICILLHYIHIYVYLTLYEYIHISWSVKSVAGLGLLSPVVGRRRPHGFQFSPGGGLCPLSWLGGHRWALLNCLGRTVSAFQGIAEDVVQRCAPLCGLLCSSFKSHPRSQLRLAHLACVCMRVHLQTPYQV